METNYILIEVWLMATLISLATCFTQSSTSSYPSLPLCDRNIVRNIHEYWRGAGTPLGVLGQITNSSGYVSVLITKNYFSPEGECLFVDASVDNSQLILTSGTKINSTDPNYSYSYSVTELQGVMSTIDQLTKFYYIDIGNNVIIAYFCNNQNGRKGPPFGGVFVESTSYNASPTQVTINFADGLLTLLGFKLTTNYGNQCV